MTWELYEVWTVDQDGHETLVDTTQSFKEAQEIADAALTEDDQLHEAIIYKEVDGELEEVLRIT